MKIFFFAAFFLFQLAQGQLPAGAINRILNSTANGNTAESKLPSLPSDATDKATELVLQNAIQKNPSFSNVKISMEKGILIISGNLETRKDSEWLHSIIKKLPHILAIVDNSKIESYSLMDGQHLALEFENSINRLKNVLPSVVLALLLIVIFYFLSGSFYKGIRKIWQKRIENPFLLRIVTVISILPIWLYVFYFTLRLLGLSTLGATLIGGTSILGIILGLAFKGIVENYLAGLLLISRSPFTRGDLIQIGEYKGYVQNLNMRGTTIIDLNGNLLLIPNIMVIQSVVENKSANPQTRTSFTIGISYNDSITKAQELIIKSIQSIKGVLPDPTPTVNVDEFNPTRVVLKVFLWFDVKETREMRIRSRAMVQTKEVLLANGFQIVAEAQEIVFKNALSLAHETHERASEKSNPETPNEGDSGQSNSEPTPEEMLKQAEKNPLPTNARTDFLKKEK